jgi:SAM-dependent methyltransferase
MEFSDYRQALMRVVESRASATGEVTFPCIPSLCGEYVARIRDICALLGRSCSERELDELKASIEQGLVLGSRSSTSGMLIVSYETHPVPRVGVKLSVRVKAYSTEERYARWLSEREPPIFGKLPDAKLMSLLRLLGASKHAPILDVGAGTGRNALPLARLGYPVTAIDSVPALVEQIERAASAERLLVQCIGASILSPDVTLEEGRYKLVVVSEVLSQFQNVDQVRTTFTKLARCVAPGGLVLANAFLAADDYEPDELAREVSRRVWSTLFTRAELRFITADLPFELVSDESAHDFEKQHTPPNDWPPTSWYESWSRGYNIFSPSSGIPPVELRWLVYERKA